ncbi:MAG: hypothetical protein KAG97_07715 [Victivallales bacterium]|nr:hypothetical protein [Victivallales bacterium]
MSIKIAQIGLGPLGRKIAQFIGERENLEIVAAVDKDEKIVGGDFGELCSGSPSGITIADSVKQAAKENEIDIVLLTTVSDMERITPQICEIANLGIPVVSTCEELSYPWLTSPALSKIIDETAKENNVAILGTGVNPGFLMDLLPTCMTSVCQSVNKIRVSRLQNAEFRRIPFQKKIGAGLTLEEFEARKTSGTLRHVGLQESIQMIAGSMGWELEKTEDILTPVIADKEIVTEAMTIPAGHAAGVQQIGIGYVKGEPKIVLNFKASVGEAESVDRIEIDGDPNIRSEIPGGVNGDVATCAITINAIKQILKAQPGLRTMSDIPVASFFS